MTYVITQGCCNDASCTAVCPVNCIHPTPDEADFSTADMLYIDPASCIDCGACMDACPVDAIFPESLLPGDMQEYARINAQYFESRPRTEPVRSAATSHPTITRAPQRDRGPLRVAVVGTGPSAHYATHELLSRSGRRVEVSMLDRLPNAGGLIRYGVAPDHQGTKSIDRTFNRVVRHEDVSLFLDVEVGRDVSHADLLDHHHAVIYASGASGDRRLGIPGEGLPGSHSAREFVAWYNGHPDAATQRFDLSGTRVVVVGNGNVALDVARILLLDPEVLARTDIADHALAALRQSDVEEVVVLGRRGPDKIACTIGELRAVADLEGIDVVVEGSGSGEPAGSDPKQQLLAELAGRPRKAGHKRLVFRFHNSPSRIVGETRVGGVDVTAGETIDHLETGLVLSAIGYRGTPIADLPFDDDSGTVPHLHGRVDERHKTYVTGWIKRGPSGAIGSNRVCATETVSTLLDDLATGSDNDARTAENFTDLIRQRRPGYVDKDGWAAIDRQERHRGRALGRPRVKTIPPPTTQAPPTQSSSTYKKEPS